MVGKAQVFQSPTPSPKLTALAEWQLRGEPVFFVGDFYYPTGPTAFFDGSVMVPSGTTGVRSGGPATPSLQSIPPPRSNAGIWIEFNGARWYSAGSAVPHVPGKFVQVGTYRGFPVYRDARPGGEIYIPSVDDGPLAPYSRR